MLKSPPDPASGRAPAHFEEVERLALTGDPASAARRFRAALGEFGAADPPEAVERVLPTLTRAFRSGRRRWEELEDVLSLARRRFAHLGRRDLEAASLLELMAIEVVRGCEAAARERWQEAARLARLSGDPALEARVWLYLGQAALRFVRHRQAEAALRKSIAGLRRAGRACELYRPLGSLAVLRLLLGDYRAARRLAVAALAGAERARDGFEVVIDHLHLARCDAGRGRFKLVARWAARAHRTARAMGYALSATGALAAVYGGLAAAASGHSAMGERLARRALEIARSLRDPSLEGPPLALLGGILVDEGRLEEARDLFETEAARGREARKRWGSAESASHLALVAYRTGRLAEAHRLAKRARAYFARHGSVDDFVGAALCLVEVYLALGRLDLARRDLLNVEAVLLPTRGLDRSEAAVALYRARLGRLRDGGRPAASAPVHARKAIAGDVEQRIELGLEEAAAAPASAPRLLEAVERRARAARLPWSLARVLIARGRLLLQSDPGASGRDLEEARAIARARGFRLLEAEAEAATVALATRARRRREAARCSRRATALRAECFAGLRIRPARPAPSPMVAAQYGLTGAEADVLAALSSGLSNAAIAKRLFVSASTVRFHLRRIFRKLNVSSRLEAALLCTGTAAG